MSIQRRGKSEQKKESKTKGDQSPQRGGKCCRFDRHGDEFTHAHTAISTRNRIDGLPPGRFHWGGPASQRLLLNVSPTPTPHSFFLDLAVQSAIESRQWKQAANIVDLLEPCDARKNWQKLAQECALVKDYEKAERFFISSGSIKNTITMYNDVSQWEDAHRLASRCMDAKEVADFYIRQAHELSEEGRLEKAERCYLMVEVPDMAIAMYKRAR